MVAMTTLLLKYLFMINRMLNLVGMMLVLRNVEFINLSTATDTGLWYWNWSFTHDTSTNYAIDWSPTFNYPTVIDTIGALVSAQLIVVDSAYCRDTFQTPDISVPDIEIHPLPIVDFVVPAICEFDYLIASDYNNSYISPFRYLMITYP